VNRLHKLLGLLVIVIALWLLAGCGGSSAAPTPAAFTTPPRSLHTGRTLMIGGNELFDRLPNGLQTPHDFGACVDNAGVKGGDSTAMLGMFSLGVLNTYPSRVIIVANNFELVYMDADTIQRNYYGMVIHSTVSGARTILVGVEGADQFNDMLRTLAHSYGAEYVDALDPAVCK
jgi:hypothetical protein